MRHCHWYPQRPLRRGSRNTQERNRRDVAGERYLPSILADERVDIWLSQCFRKIGWTDSVQVDSVRETVTSREEVRPMNVLTMWVLPLVFTAGR